MKNFKVTTTMIIFSNTSPSTESLIEQNNYRIRQKRKAIERENQLLITGDKHRSNEQIKNNIKRLKREIEKWTIENEGYLK